MRSKEIFFLILLIAAGVFFYYAYTDKLDWEIEWGDDFLFKLEEFEFEESQTNPLFLLSFMWSTVTERSKSKAQKRTESSSPCRKKFDAEPLRKQGMWQTT
jgi:hypothetical protein